METKKTRALLLSSHLNKDAFNNHEASHLENRCSPATDVQLPE